MSGPVTSVDAPIVPEQSAASTPPRMELIDGRETTVGALPVRRVLPRRSRRTVGAWCFVDHMGPRSVTPDRGVDIGPHPHIGLHTVTWLLAGEMLHHDSIGSEQMVRPGQLNLMTAGRGVAHAEEGTSSYRGDLHGVQLWVAQPDATRHGAPAFEHHSELPQVELNNSVLTVLVGSLAGVTSPARTDTPLVGADAVMSAGSTVWPLRADFEHAVVVLDGSVVVDDEEVLPGRLGYLGDGREELALTVPDAARLLLIGGEPFPEPVLIWWNYVARTQQEVELAGQEWNAHTERFGDVNSRLPRIPSPLPPWRSGPP